MEKNNTMKLTKLGFEKSFKEANFYNKQTMDNSHLTLLLNLVNPTKDETILDLGTGSGYLAFPIAKQNPECNVIGLDIFEATLERNTQTANELSISNVEFVSYDGISYPFESSSIDTIITRYALHHFPDLDACFTELYRILKPNGKLIISDPTPNDNDDTRFVDEFMQMKKDGHIKFYTFAEYIAKLNQAGFHLKQRIDTTITFPRKNPKDYESLLQNHAKNIIEGYEIKITDDEIWIKENVLNIVFEKNNP
ncbi:class I SAM-dependent methyltransferase [Anaerosporobacter sp.]|uniref:class I SAM-dependent methyltransferase n=1 Tax=Anaerosporobacter sp. TaxID=1872529 RepID=UPI00286F2ED8|nr:class I SAM-dependent methyltransferase [Anaerosporobacter sp.]